MEIAMKVNDRGFTLIEVTIAAALLGGLSLVFMQMTKDTTKSSTKFQLDSDVTLTTNEINSILSDPQKCLTTFATNAKPTSIDGKFLIATAGAPSQGYGNAGLKITSYTLTVDGNNGNLAIAYENKNILKGTSGPGSIIKNINLYVEGTAGAITKCRSLSTAASDIWRRQTPGSGIYFNEGNVGIGTTPTADSLTVAGTITSTSGGLKFPDGSVLKSAPPICTDATQALHWNGSAWSCDTLDFSSAILAAITSAITGQPAAPAAPVAPATVASPPTCTGANQTLHWNGASWSCDTLASTGTVFFPGEANCHGKKLIQVFWNPISCTGGGAGKCYSTCTTSAITTNFNTPTCTYSNSRSFPNNSGCLPSGSGVCTGTISGSLCY
jgi:prepilin-type N-terminal cleavage/methylation domain-containing protein